MRFSARSHFGSSSERADRPIWEPSRSEPESAGTVTEMPEVSSDVLAARAKLAERFNAVRTGGKGTARRTKLSKHVNNGATPPTSCSPRGR
mmetsp:Transcript_9773/g.11849  ORF Transcript_9773/g.11849 Transcript_9773/m.11849 type:complete len:91 (+) Transcript_9773:1-273(+)